MAYLEKCESDPSWIKRHDRKVRNSIAAFFAALLILGTVGYQFSFGVMGTRTDIEYLNRLIERHPGNPYLYANLGSHHYRLKNFDVAARVWETSLSLKPDNVLVLNNLAWLYATCESPAVCLPERALQLAKAAVDLDDSHFVLDTLAESLYANGMYAEAIQTEKRALQKAAGADEQKMYREQINKFRKALEAETLGQ
jgi:tetratricopeptide (TPR) repeat protein